MSWNEPYFEDLPEGTYDVVVESVDYNPDKDSIAIKGTVTNSAYAGAPLAKTIYCNGDFGMRQLKGIIHKVVDFEGRPINPTCHQEAGDGAYAWEAYLSQKLLGATVQFRLDESISGSKVYKNTWFHAILSDPKAPLNASTIVEQTDEIAF